jgi:hypothetical protein
VLVDACRKAQEIGSLLGVQTGDMTTGGNAILGQSGALHATGKMAVAVRGTGIRWHSPQVRDITIRQDSTVSSTTFPMKTSTAGSFSIDLAVGGLPGIRIGDTRVGAVDVLGSLSLTPPQQSAGLRLRFPDPRGLALGLRVGILEETRTLPAASLTAMVRGPGVFSVKTPPMPIDSGGTVRMEFRDATLISTAFRLAASKQVGRYGFTAGLGTESYHLSTPYEILTAGNDRFGEYGGSGEINFHTTRRLGFAGASYTLGRATIGAEFGRLTGGRVPAMVNSFGGRPVTAARNFLTVGVRFAAGRTAGSG